MTKITTTTTEIFGEKSRTSKNWGQRKQEREKNNCVYARRGEGERFRKTDAHIEHHHTD